MENELRVIEWSDDQRRIFVDAAQLHEAYMDAFSKSRACRGGMHWKKAKGRDYLFRSLDRRGYGKSLGPRSDRTESVYKEFHENKQRTLDRMSHLKLRLQEQARFCKAARIERVPRIVTAVLRVLEQHQLLGRHLRIVGTNALYAYEARAGIFFQRGLMATQDMDMLWDVRPKLRLFAVDGVDSSGLIGILQKADRSFALIGTSSFRAVNRSGYMVDLIKPEHRSMLGTEKRRMGGMNDMAATEIRNLQWLVSAPKFDQVVIGEDGYPAAMTVPDPRAFAIHKIWLSAQVDREAVRKKRDYAQAVALCKLILRYLPEFEFKPEELRMFPRAVVAETLRTLEDMDLPPGYNG
jgi:hypothetical protein